MANINREEAWTETYKKCHSDMVHERSDNRRLRAKIARLNDKRRMVGLIIFSQWLGGSIWLITNMF